MAILGAWGEDLDFTAGAAVTVDTTAARFRSYARCSIVPTTGGTTAKSSPLPGGAVSSLWASFQVYTATWQANVRAVGICRSGTEKGIWIGGTTGAATKLALLTWDGSNHATLASEAGTSLVNSVLARFDIQIVSFGASSTIRVYKDGVLLIDFSGNSSISGISDLDSIYNFKNSTVTYFISECFIADEDTRLMTMQTKALTGDGTTTDWTGVYSTINQATISDTTPNYSNTAAQLQQFDVTDMAAGVWTIKARKISARLAKSADATPTKIALGYNRGGTTASGAGGDKTLTGSYATYETLDNTDPTNSGAAWAAADDNSMQIQLASVA